MANPAVQVNDVCDVPEVLTLHRMWTWNFRVDRVWKWVRCVSVSMGSQLTSLTLLHR